jgi:hypothetical protein
MRPLVMVALLSLLQLTAPSVTVGSAQSSDARRVAMRALVDAAFPELPQARELMVTRMGQIFDVRIGPMERPTFHGIVSTAGERDVYVDAADFGGTYLHTDALVNMQFRGRSDASLTMVVEELNRLGARFGPDKRDELVAAASLNRYAAVLGRINRMSAEFMWAGPKDELGRRNLYVPVWRLILQNTGHGTTMCSTLHFEPIDGRLSYLRQRPCRR